MASSIDVEKEKSVVAKETVNSSSYTRFHGSQMFEQGLSFSGNERNKVWVNTGGAFADLSDLSGADTPNDSRAAIAADFDDDGDVDLFVHSIQRERHALYRNDAVRPGVDAGFVKVRLQATSTQHEAVGAIVRVIGPAGPTAQIMARGSGFLSCQPPELVFGLGGARAARVEVIWPGTGGRAESFGDVEAGARVLLVEGAGAARAFAAHTHPLPDPLPPGLRLEEGDPLPRIALLDRDGREVVLDVAEVSGGKPVLVNFWASYCAPCVAELPLLARKDAEGDVRVVAISVDVPEDVEKARGLLETNRAGFACYFPRPEGEAPAEAVGLGEVVDLERLSLPTTVVVSAEGRIESILRGPLGE